MQRMTGNITAILPEYLEGKDPPVTDIEPTDIFVIIKGNKYTLKGRLTVREATILRLLADAAPRRGVSRATIIEAVFETPADEPEYVYNSVARTVSKLTDKLTGSGLSISTHRGWGWALELPDEQN